MERRLAKDAQGERSVGRLRLVAAFVSVIAVAWLLVLTEFGWPALVLGLGVALAARFWAKSWARTERAFVATPAADLVLDDDALRLGDRAVPWAVVARVELDNDRLLVRVVPTEGAGESIEIEPPYGGLGLDALGRQIEEARRAAQGRG